MIRTLPKVATGILLAGVLGLAPLAAGADSSTSTVPTTTTSQAGVSAGVSVWATFRISWEAYVNGLRAIDATYRSSVESARATYRTSLASATTKAERVAARATLSATIATALNVRVAAIIAAGNPPTPPVGFKGTAWVTGFQSANVAFRAAVGGAQSTLAASLSAATDHAQREEARLMFRSAVDNALAVHISALAALGAPPKHPGKVL